MPETTFPSTELTSQYTAQVAHDLERIAKEQERIGAEIAALQEQLLGLQHDHTILVNMQKALGASETRAQTAPSPEDVAVPAPRRKAPAKPAAAKRSRVKKAGTEQSSNAPKKTAAKAAVSKTAKPTLVELIRSHLAKQAEPRSAAEIATTLGQAHPDRGVKATVVRTTLEGLVAKSQAQRTKQGSSVFYTAADTSPAQPEAPSGNEVQPARADR
ncbi:hypothetical protein [Streptomyces griseorubiginosus]|uniref:hypothetical protein n=1 Tax=Streptomyces griseorubiginosus TaxID=67304 RepID=UPI0011408DC8|nr:hypothetical protein [Streptomyces griseorubiginosus]